MLTKQQYEQYKQIIADAPEGSTHVEMTTYGENEWWSYNDEKDQLLWNCFDPILQENIWQYQNVDSDSISDFHALSDLKTLVAQYEEIERLKKVNLDQLINCFVEGFKTSGEGFNGEYPYSDNGISDSELKSDLRGSIGLYLRKVVEADVFEINDAILNKLKEGK